VGPSTSKKILKKLEISAQLRTKELSAEQANKLREEVEKKYKVEGELKHEVKMNIKRLKEIGCYRGLRHAKGLPVHGQRTKTNSRTVRGNVRKTMGSGRRTESKT
jgi:small subunit ribosomal protein S13